jgi:hypothetical protein
MCHTSDLKALQPGCFSKSQMQMSYPVDGNSAYSLISRELFFYVLHFEKNRGCVPENRTSHTAPCKSMLGQGDRILIPCNDVDRRLESDLITGS